MQRAQITLDPSFAVAPVNRRTFGSFVEHMGRCVYTGIYEPGHRSADEHGFRADVLELTRELGVTLVRYPGGNFVSGYRWEDGVGPRDARPVRRDLAWHSTEPNEFGTDEFLRWAGLAGVEPMLAVNLGTRGLEEALDLHEYVNHPGGTRLSDLRAAHASTDPYGVRYWCLGNEMDGPWQIGHKTAREYGRLAAEVARGLRRAEEDLRLVACGSSSAKMPTFGAWEATVLEECYDEVDLVSLHAYYEPPHGDDLGSFLASGQAMDQFIDDVIATADFVRARLRRSKRINLSFDEWNVWYSSRFDAQPQRVDWPHAPRLIEDCYDVTDAVTVGGLIISLLRHSDRVTTACQAQLVNVIAPIRTEPDGPAWRQTIFHPFAQAARHARGEVLRVEPRGARHETEEYGEVTTVDAVATYEREHHRASVFAVNRSLTESVRLEIDVRAFGLEYVEACSTLAEDDLRLTNTQQHPDRVRPRANTSTEIEAGRVTVLLPPVSWTVLLLGRVAEA